MRRITVYADDHMASRAVRALEELGADYMAEDYAMPKLPPRRDPPERAEQEPEPVGTAGLLKRQSGEERAYPPLNKQVQAALRQGPKTLDELYDRLDGYKFGEKGRGLTRRSLAGAIAMLVRFKKIEKIGEKYHATETL